MRLKRSLRILGLLLAIGTLPGVVIGDEWQVPVEVENGIGEKDTVSFGIHPDGTIGVDLGLGEMELPPWPPSELFDVRFIVPGVEGLKLDIRDTTRTLRTHRLEWQTGAGGYPVVVRWDRYSLPEARMHVSDGYGGIFVGPINLYEADSLVVPDSLNFIDVLLFEVIPGVHGDASPELDEIPGYEVFAGQEFPLYELDDHVFDPDTPDWQLEWYVTGNMALVFEVDEERVLHIEAPDGWTGGETVTFTVRDPDGNTDQTEATFGVVEPGLPSWEVPLWVENRVGETRTVYLGVDPSGTDGVDGALGEVELPPWPPSDVFDARMRLPDLLTFVQRDMRGSTADSIDYVVKWQAGSGGYPVTVCWPCDDLPLGDFTIKDEMGGVFIPPTDMRDTCCLVIPEPQSFITGLVIVVTPVVDLDAPVGPETLWVEAVVPGDSVTLGWDACIEEHFAYYEVLYDSMYFDDDAEWVWDWDEDSAMTDQGYCLTTIPLNKGCSRYMFRVRAWDSFGNVGALSNLVTIGEAFIRGDDDGDGVLTISDPIQSLCAQFAGCELACLDASDVDDNGEVNISDAIYSLAAQFSGGPPPPAPFPECGVDPTQDALGCDCHEFCMGCGDGGVGVGHESARCEQSGAIGTAARAANERPVEEPNDDGSTLSPSVGEMRLRVKPNPFSGCTQISYMIPAACWVQVSIYDVSGRLVRNVLKGSLPAGCHDVVWDGRDETGLLVPAGVYFCRMATPAGLRTYKAVRSQ